MKEEQTLNINKLINDLALQLKDKDAFIQEKESKIFNLKQEIVVLRNKVNELESSGSLMDKSKTDLTESILNLKKNLEETSVSLSEHDPEKEKLKVGILNLKKNISALKQSLLISIDKEKKREEGKIRPYW